MNVIAILLFALYGIVGGLTTLALVVSLPGIIGWKFYRKIKYHKPLTA
ncbi:MAG: hypothetical protein ACOYA8_08265 [Clostridium sp.]|jgi:hypothetical protein